MKMKCSFEIVKMDDEVIVVPVGENAGSLKGVIKLNNSGAEIFESLCKGNDVESIVKSLAMKYDNSPEELAALVNDMISELQKIDVISE